MTKYRKAPLVELIAELQWNLPSVTTAFPPGFEPPPGVVPTNFPFFGHDQGKLEEFVSAFSEECFKGGIHSVERLMPPGFPITVGQVSTRMRKSPASPEMYQVGPGVFTANAIPPYDSWSAFSPFLNNGIEMLLRSRIEGERDLPFTAVSLQYVDAFSSNLTRGMPAAKFMRDVLGFAIDAPAAILGLVADGADVNSNLQMTALLEGGLSLNLSLGEGVANNSSAIIMQTNIVALNPIEPSVEAVLSVLHRSQEAQHAIFKGVIKSIEDRMEPYL
ncbi:TIGR04255 family protein [Pseudomonas alliivorans]|uniref:TIGR04255 family protein n=1 Tax=Pseudomonas alliivorans TaxID=2810613 RepID=UPI00403B3620